MDVFNFFKLTILFAIVITIYMQDEEKNISQFVELYMLYKDSRPLVVGPSATAICRNQYSRLLMLTCLLMLMFVQLHLIGSQAITG